MKLLFSLGDHTCHVDKVQNSSFLRRIYKSQHSPFHFKPYCFVLLWLKRTFNLLSVQQNTISATMLLTSLTECILIFFLPWLFYHAFQFARILFKLKKIGKAVDQFPMDKKHWLKGHVDKVK